MSRQAERIPLSAFTVLVAVLVPLVSLDADESPKPMTGDVIAMEFDGGTNLDPARDDHIHSIRIELVSADEVREDWVGWSAGKPKEPVTKFHLRRKKA